MLQVLKTFTDAKVVSFFKGSRFTKCDACAYFGSMRRKLGHGAREKHELINDAHAAHVVWQMFEVDHAPSQNNSN